MPGGIPQRRLLTELAALAERYPATRMVKLALEAPTFEVILEVEGTQHPVRLILPPGYPEVPPEVRELTAPGGRVRAANGAMHRFPDGTLCLFPHGNDPQGWHAGRCAADALDQCVALLRKEHAEGGVRRMLYQGHERLIISPGAAQLFRLPEGRGMMSLGRAGQEGRDLFVTSITEDLHGQVVPGIEACWAKVLVPAGEALWVRLDAGGRAWNEHLSDASTLRALLTAALPEALARRAQLADPLVLVPAERDGAVGWLLRRPPAPLGAIHFSEAVITTPDELLFRRVDPVLDRREAMAEVRVVIVGLGSLGGAVAQALARSGFCRFVLVDPDQLSLENVSRHVGSTRDLGRRKVDIIADAIVAINPRAVVERIPQWLAGDIAGYGAGAEFATLLARPDRTLVITTCAVGRVERQINALALRRGTPAIYAAVLGAGAHGRVFRVIPGESPCYECVHLAQLHQPDAFPAFPVGTAAEGQPYSDPGLPGLAIDIGQIALITARFALQTVARVHGLDLGMADEIGDHLLWTNHGGWGFDRPLQIEVVRVPRAEGCHACGRDAPTEELSAEELAELTRLMAEATAPRR